MGEPTREGYYFATPQWEDASRQVVYFDRTMSRVNLFGTSEAFNLSDFRNWSGPITETPHGDSEEGNLHLVSGEGYPANWLHAVIHLNPTTGDMHSDGAHAVRRWIEDKIKAKETPIPAEVIGLIRRLATVVHLMASKESGHAGYGPTADVTHPVEGLCQHDLCVSARKVLNLEVKAPQGSVHVRC